MAAYTEVCAVEGRKPSRKADIQCGRPDTEIQSDCKIAVMYRYDPGF